MMRNKPGTEWVKSLGRRGHWASAKTLWQKTARSKALWWEVSVDWVTRVEKEERDLGRR